MNRDAIIEECAVCIDVLADMTFEPQATAYRFAAYRIRSLKSSSQEERYAILSGEPQ